MASDPGRVGPFERWGHVVFRRRRWVLAVAGVFLAFAATWGTGVFGSLISSGFETPGSESARALAQAEDTVGRDAADVVVLYRDGGRSVDDPRFREAVQQHLADLPPSLVKSATTWWSTNGTADALVSHDRTQTYAVLHLVGNDEDALMDAYDALEPRLRDAPPGLTVQLGGDEAISSDITNQVSEDIGRAEQLSLPIVMVLLVVVFGGLTAASLPLAIGGLAILGSFTMLRLLTLTTDVSIFSINIVTMLGLGLAIDYALFVVSRFREELRGGASTEQALVRTMSTAGRTVAFSGLTVAISLASLLLFPQIFLRSMGFGGMAAVLVAMIGALTVLPALLAVLGHRVDSLRMRVPRRLRRTSTRPRAEQGGWTRLAHSVMRRPVVYVAVIVPVLLLAGSPFLRAEFGGVDHRALPAGTESRVVAETLIADFPGGGTSTIDPVVLRGRHCRRCLARCLRRGPARAGRRAVGHCERRAGRPAVLSIHHAFEGISSDGS